MRTRILGVAVAAAVFATFWVADGRAQNQPDSGVVTVVPSFGGLVWVINVPYELAKLRVSGPTGAFKGAFQAEMPAVKDLPDGEYHYELFVFPPAGGTEAITLNGSFAVQGGAVVNQKQK